MRGIPGSVLAAETGGSFKKPAAKRLYGVYEQPVAHYSVAEWTLKPPRGGAVNMASRAGGTRTSAIRLPS